MRQLNCVEMMARAARIGDTIKALEMHTFGRENEYSSEPHKLASVGATPTSATISLPTSAKSETNRTSPTGATNADSQPANHQ